MILNLNRILHLIASRRVPLPLRKHLKNELDRIERNCVIKRVTGPPEWYSLAVIVAEPNEDIRICVNLTELNRCVERHPY